MLQESSTDVEKSPPLAISSDSEELAASSDVAVLAEMGYKQELRRNFSMLEVFGIAFSVMGLLPSIAATLTYSLAAGPAGLVWVSRWLVQMCLKILMRFSGLAMADLASAMPTAGGLYWWTHYFAAEKVKNPLCFLVGYSNTLGLISGVCGVDYGFALMLLSVVVIARDGEWTPSNGTIYCVFMGCILCHAILASTLSKIMGKLQTIFATLNLILILATIIALPIGRGSRRNDASYIFTESANLTSWPSEWSFVLSFISPIWVMGGFDSCVHISEEASNAPRAVPQAIIAAIGSGWVLGWILCITIAACMSQDLDSTVGSPFGQPMAQIYYDALGKNGALGLMALLSAVQFLMGVSLLVAASRQAWAFSRDGALPFSKFFRPISRKFGFVPIRTIWGCAIAALITGLLCLIAPAAASALFSLGVVGNYLAFLIPIFCRLVWGQAKFRPGPFYTGRFSVPIAWVAITFMTLAIVLGMFPIGGPDPGVEGMNYTVVIASAVWGGSLLYYFVDARKWFTGPKSTLEVDRSSEDEQSDLKGWNGQGQRRGVSKIAESN